MEYGIIFFILIGVYLIFIEINKLKKQIKSQQKQIDTLCKKTGNIHLATYYLSEDDKEYILHLKNSGKETEAIKKARDVTSMDLLQAKHYVDSL